MLYNYALYTKEQTLKEKKIESRTLFEGKIITVKKDLVSLGDDKTATREIVLHKKAVAVVPVVEEGFILIRQFRYAADEILWEIPAGIMEDGETPDETAQRELIEETGFRPVKLEQLCRFYTTPGFSNEEVIIYYSQNLTPDRSFSPDPDENIEMKVFSHSEIRASLKNGLIRDSKTIIGLLLALEKIEKA